MIKINHFQPPYRQDQAMMESYKKFLKSFHKIVVISGSGSVIEEYTDYCLDEDGRIQT